MQIQLNRKNAFTCLIGASFLYLFYIIWSSKEHFPELEVDLRDLIRWNLGMSRMRNKFEKPNYAHTLNFISLKSRIAEALISLLVGINISEDS